jgi:FkbM family methyltransferase|tara:strand:- start:14074 stop:15390 length:1317 start_codon:yes stop_codon:yes gene_type:complete
MKKTETGMWLPTLDTFFENRGDYEIRDYNIAKSYFKNRTGIALDIGAHCGYWSKRLVKDFEQVVAFEPTPDHYECLVKNCEGNTNFRAVNNAVSEAPAKLYMEQTFSNSGMTHIVDGKTDLEVVAVNLDAVFSKEVFVDFIKIDVEGHEADVIRGGLRLIKRCHPTIFVEILDVKSTGGSYVQSTLLDLGYILQKTVEKNQIWVWDKPIQFLHVPKTGGTALKNAQKIAKKEKTISTPYLISNSHEFVLSSYKDNVGVIIRDPWKRFCSGFWERKTNDLRQALNSKADPQFKENIKKTYLDLTEKETEILSQCNTPNDLITYIKQNPDVLQLCTKQNQGFPLGVVLAPLTDWLGTVVDYKEHEHKVGLACSTGQLTSTMKTHFNMDMPTDPFLARTRTQFDVKQSYDCTPENLKFFKNMRAQDYELMNYIISSEKYVG